MHIRHDYKKGTKIYPHIHWSHKSNKSWDVEWKIEYTYARWYSLDEYPDPTTISLVQTAWEKYEHHIIEADASQAIDLPNMDTDGVILFRIYRDAKEWDDTLDDHAYLINFDLHYESDWYLTTEKNPDLWGTDTFIKNIA